MSQLLLTDLEDATISTLEERAARHGRTPQDEAKAILAEALTPKAKALAGVDAIYNRLAASGRVFSDSVELLREDRER